MLKVNESGYNIKLKMNVKYARKLIPYMNNYYVEYEQIDILPTKEGEQYCKYCNNVHEEKFLCFVETLTKKEFEEEKEYYRQRKIFTY